MAELNAGDHDISFKFRSAQDKPNTIKGLGFDLLTLEGYDFKLYSSYANNKGSSSTVFTSPSWA